MNIGLYIFARALAVLFIAFLLIGIESAGLGWRERRDIPSYRGWEKRSAIREPLTWIGGGRRRSFNSLAGIMASVITMKSRTGEPAIFWSTAIPVPDGTFGAVLPKPLIAYFPAGSRCMQVPVQSMDEAFA